MPLTYRIYARIAVWCLERCGFRVFYIMDNPFNPDLVDCLVFAKSENAFNRHCNNLE